MARTSKTEKTGAGSAVQPFAGEQPVASPPPSRIPGDLGNGFRTSFELAIADTPVLQDRVYQLRHSVYCEDLQVEAAREDGREADEYDRYATSILLRHIATSEFIACARLIRPVTDDSDGPLPFERICAHTLDHELLSANPIPRDRVAEASRLAIIAKFRRRSGEAPVPAVLSDRDFGDEHFPRFPYIIIGLYLGMVALARRDGIQRLYVLTEPRLAEHLSRLGIQIIQIGGPVEHRGTRFPSMIIVEDVIRNLNRYIGPMYEEIARQICRPSANATGLQ